MLAHPAHHRPLELLQYYVTTYLDNGWQVAACAAPERLTLKTLSQRSRKEGRFRALYRASESTFSACT